MIFQHARFQIWNANQHPYRHTLNEMPYSNDATGSEVTNIQGALDWLFKVVYPQPQDPVATTAALPAVGNTLNDYRVVQDDGDGKAAAYRWEQREGDAAAKWYKIYDMDWGVDSVLSGFFRATQDHYVVKRGTDDIDSTGAFIAGTFAGQRIYGGASASTNLTLSANAGDGTGAQTGYVQFTDQVRPTTSNAIDLGNVIFPFRTGRFGTSVVVGTLTVAAASITDSSGAISFNDENLTTTGSVTAGSFVRGTLTIGAASITDSSGSISFDNENLTTTGTISGTTTKGGNLSLAANILSSTDTNGNIAITPNGTGTITLSKATSVTGVLTANSLVVDATTLDNNTFTTSAANNLTLSPGGNVVITSSLFTAGIATTGSHLISGDLGVDNLSLDGNTLSATSGSLVFTAGAVSMTYTGGVLRPNTDGALDLGTTALRWQTLYIGTAIGDGTTTISSGTLQSLRDINTGVASGDTLSWNGSKWIPVNYDTTIPHSGLTGLTSGDDHTQYGLLAGRSSGQTFTGDTAASGNLTLQSTSNGTKGSVLVTGTLSPSADNTYPLGASGARWTTLYMNGELHGARLENFTTAGRPAASAGTPGRVIWDTDLKDILVDIGGTWFQRSVDKYYNEDASGWTGSSTTVSYTMPSDISDARKMVWQLKDNSNNFKVILCDITHTGASNTTVTVEIALAAGTYTLIGVG